MNLNNKLTFTYLPSSLAVGDWALHDEESYDNYLLDQLLLIGGLWGRCVSSFTAKSWSFLNVNDVVPNACR
jgi:hypothetical protein